jgi:hypothetical protein
LTCAFSPASTVIAQACASPACRVVMVRRATAPIEGKASPRKPSVRISSRSSSGSFEVAWRSTASARSSRVMPAPSSLTWISLRPPPSVRTSMRVAPASSAFSTSSFTTLAGRSTTSPAAMRLTMPSESWRTGIYGTLGANRRIGTAQCIGPGMPREAGCSAATSGDRYSAAALARVITSGGDA